jgi:hypothetical protein
MTDEGACEGCDRAARDWSSGQVWFARCGGKIVDIDIDIDIDAADAEVGRRVAPA